MLYGIFDDKAGSGIVGNFSPAGGPPLCPGTDSRHGQGWKDLATSTGCEEAP